MIILFYMSTFLIQCKKLSFISFRHSNLLFHGGVQIRRCYFRVLWQIEERIKWKIIESAGQRLETQFGWREARKALNSANKIRNSFIHYEKCVATTMYLNSRDDQNNNRNGGSALQECGGMAKMCTLLHFTARKNTYLLSSCFSICILAGKAPP